MNTQRARLKRGLIPVLVGGLLRVAVPVGMGVAAGTVAQAVKAKPASAQAATGNFSCSASVVRVELPPPTVLAEPFKANKPDNPCKADHQGLLAPTTSGPVTVSVASADTAGFDFDRTIGHHAGNPPNPSTCRNADGTTPLPGPCADATASVVNAAVAMPGLNLSAKVITADAHGRCEGKTAVLSGDSHVVSLTINGMPTEIPTAKNTAVGPVTLREETVTPGRVTERAIDVFVPGVARVIIAEATVDSTGDNPCEPPRMCTDTVNGNDSDSDDDIVIPQTTTDCECPPDGTGSQPRFANDADDKPCGGSVCPTGTHKNPLFPPTNPPCCPDNIKSDDGNESDDTDESAEPANPPGGCVCEEADDSESDSADHESADSSSSDSSDESADASEPDVPEVPCCPPDSDSDDGQLTTENNQSCECPPVTADADDSSQMTSSDSSSSDESADSDDDSEGNDEGCPPPCPSDSSSSSLTTSATDTSSASSDSDSDGDDDACEPCSSDSSDSSSDSMGTSSDSSDDDCTTSSSASIHNSNWKMV